MSDKVNEMKIKFVKGGRTLDQEILQGCYFYPIEGTNKYNFFSKFDMPLARNVEDGKPFGFTLGPFNWAIVTDFALASGSWANTDGPDFPEIRIPDIEEEGSFQVQTGGNVEQSAAYASA